MFRILDLDATHTLTLRSDSEALTPPPRGVLRWIDLVQPEPAALAQLQAHFDLDSLAIADCRQFGAVSKVDDYERYLFVVVHAFTAHPDDPMEVIVHEIHAFLGESFLVTVHDNPVPAHDRIWDRASREPGVLSYGPSWALYLVLRAMIDATEPVVERIDDELDVLERSIIEEERDLDPKLVFRIKRAAVAMRRSLRPQRDTLRILHRRGAPLVSTRAARYLRDLADVVGRLTESVEEVAESATSVQGTSQALQATKATDLMKKLTIFSAVFLPLGVIVGFWGQNFRDLPTDSDVWLGLTIASMVLVPAGLLEWIRQNWL